MQILIEFAPVIKIYTAFNLRKDINCEAVGFIWVVIKRTITAMNDLGLPSACKTGRQLDSAWCLGLSSSRVQA